MSKAALFKLEILLAMFLIILFGGLSVRKVVLLKHQARRGVSERNLSKLRDAIAVYRGDNEGRCPPDLDALAPDYIEKVPVSCSAGGKESSKVLYGGYPDVCDGKGGWVYVNDKTDKDYCSVFLNTND